MPGMFNFCEVPRTFGNPSQQLVKSERVLIKLIDANKGKAPCFISHNSFSTLIVNKNGFEEPYQINVNKLFLDFDSDRKPENAQLDAIKVVEFCEKENIPVLSVFSGSKGFHCYIAFKPENYIFGQYLKDATKAIHIWLMKTLGLRTIDLKCAEPRRLCRVFYTPHVKLDKKTGAPIANGMYCCPLRPDWLKEWHMDEIMRYAVKPKRLQYQPRGDLLTLSEFIARFKIDIDEMLRTPLSEGSSTQNMIVDYIPCKDAYIKDLLPLPCVHSQMMGNINPPHFARFAAAAWFASIGLSREWSLKFFQERNYVDHSDVICITQINNIYERGYKFPSCTKLFENNLCVGKVCPRFANFVAREKIQVVDTNSHTS
jgi:hypothetical protein